MKHLTSRDNPQVKQLIALSQSSRERKKAGLTVLDGEHLVTAYIDALGPPRALYVAEPAATVLTALIARVPEDRVYLVDERWIKEASGLESPARAIGLIDTPVSRAPSTSADAVLVLEDVQDPGNVGSMLRSAAAAGVAEVVTSPTCAFAWSPKVLRAAQGAHFVLNIAEGLDLLAYVQSFQGQALALAPRANVMLHRCDLRGPTAFLVGNEGAGLSAELQAAAKAVSIPMPGRVESLNVAASAAIALFEMVRQRQP